ncbi:MAG: hypothetical protein HS113_27500 [Verrucomicrobiales bacterium]|nr:hypothetical protein [Verrucomicrobiales bacterium]
MNDAPTLAAIANQTINEDTSTGAIALTVGDVDNDVNGLTLTATSSNTGLVPAGAMVFGGSGVNRTLGISTGRRRRCRTVRFPVLAVPGVVRRRWLRGISLLGVALTVGDVDRKAHWASSNTGLVPRGGCSGVSELETITLSTGRRSPCGVRGCVRADGDRNDHTLAALSDQTVPVNSSTGPIAVTVGDVDNDVNGLTLTATSSNTGLVPSGAMVFGGSGANRTLTIIKLANLAQRRLRCGCRTGR